MSAQNLTVDEAAARIGCSRGFVYALIHKRKLTPIKVGRGTRIDPREVENYLASCRGKRLGRPPRKKIPENSAPEKAAV